MTALDPRAIEDMAALLWRTEAEEVGAPASVPARRTREAFDEQSDVVKDNWRKFARVARSQPQAGEPVAEPCGGCGETNPDKRCIGCLHPFATHFEPLSAAIGAGSQAVAWTWVENDGQRRFADGEHTVAEAKSRGRNVTPLYTHPAPSGQAVVVKDWITVAKSAGTHGIRYRTNAALEKFLTEILSALSQPHPADERVVDAERRRAVGQGMAIAAGIVMSGWGNTVYAKEILDAAGYTSVEVMKADGVEDYDIDLCRPALDELASKEASHATE